MLLNAINLVPVLAVGALSVAAGPVAPPPIERLPADTGWVVHVDVEALVASHLGRALLDSNDGQPIMVDEDTTWHEVQEELDIDPNRDLLSFTMYNAGDVDTDAVIMLEGTSKIDELVDLLPELLPSYRATQINGVDVHTWTEIVDDQRKHWYAHVEVAGDPNRRRCVISENWEQVIDAVERMDQPVIDAAAPAIVDPLPGVGSLIYAAGSGFGDLDEADDAWLSRMARFARSFVVDIREHDDALNVLTVVRGDSEEEMTNLAQMIQGLVAMANLAMGEDEGLSHLRPILREIRIDSDRDQLRIQLHVPIDVVVTGVQDSNVLVDSRVEGRSLSIGVGARTTAAPDEDQSEEAADDAGARSPSSDPH